MTCSATPTPTSDGARELLLSRLADSSYAPGRRPVSRNRPSEPLTARCTPPSASIITPPRSRRPTTPAPAIGSFVLSSRTAPSITAPGTSEKFATAPAAPTST